MPKTPVVTVTLPWGEKLMRATWRKYTHAVIYTGGNQNARALAWCGSLKLAGQQLKYWSGQSGKRLAWRVPGATEGSWELAIYPVDAAVKAEARPVRVCTRCGRAIRDAEYLNETGGPRHLNACPMA